MFTGITFISLRNKIINMLIYRIYLKLELIYLCSPNYL